jgi:DNA repair protein RadC
MSDWPYEDRPLEKLFNKGAPFLTDTELIAVLLKTGIRGKTAVDIARELLAEYGSLKKLLHAPFTALSLQQGVGPAKYAVLKAAVELGKRYWNEEIPKGAILNSSARTQKFLTERLREHTNEVFACLFMDNCFRLLSFEELFQGTIHSAMVYIREIVKRGLHHNAAKIILAHNHPSGHSLPSEADKEVTLRIKQAVSLIDIEVIDHIIIGHAEHFSFAEAGLMDSLVDHCSHLKFLV